MPLRHPMILAALLSGPLTMFPAFAQDTAEPDTSPPMIAEIKTAGGASLGTATAVATPSGLMLVTLELRDVPPGIHGVHLHETGTCTPPDFDSAGGHLADGKEHGVMSPGGPHPGDLPNLHVPESGALTVEYFVAGLTTGMMTDEDGTAIIIHEHPDDYIGQPTGHAGPRLGCGSFAAAG